MGSMARPERFELPTFWFVASDLLRISKLHRTQTSAPDRIFRELRAARWLNSQPRQKVLRAYF